MDPIKARKLAKIIALIVAFAMIITSFSFVMFLPGLFGANGSVVYGANGPAVYAENGPAVYAANGSAAYGAAGDVDPDKKLENLRKYIEYIKNNYKDDITYKQLLNGAFEGVANSLDDPYSTYYETSGQADAFVQSVSGEYSGVGVSIENYNGKCRVVAPISGTPAEKSGIKTGDIITKIDGIDISKKTLDEAAEMMRGKAGTKVTLTVSRGGQVLNFPLTREVIKTISVHQKMLDKQIGYIQITGFDSDSHEEFESALSSLQKQGMKSLIIDLRNNPGGLVNVALNIANQLMPEGPLMHYEHKGEIIKTYNADDAAKADFPIVMLVNEGSASSSEILAGALHDSKTAKLVGTRTFGKGVAQQIENFPEGYGLKLSTLYFLTPNKSRIDHAGITPDYTVQNTTDLNVEELAKKYQGFAPMIEKEKPTAGSVGLNVFGAQQRLSMLGYPVQISGTMDDATVAGVKKFQKESGLYSGGVLDYTTMNALDKATVSYITGAGSTRDLQMEKAISLLD